jgi:hypothetical protein
MDLYRIIGTLHDERKRIERVIRSLESESQVSKPTRLRVVSPRSEGKGRGRKSMNSGERRAVSERMTLYWAKRRAGSGTPPGRKPGAKGLI